MTASGQANFIAGQTLFRVSRSRYGRQLAQTSSSQISQAQSLSFEAIDSQHKQQLETKIQACQQALVAQRTRDEELSAEQTATKAEVDACRARMEAIQNRKAKRSRTLAQYNTLQTKLDGERTKLEMELQGQSLEQEKVKAKRELARIAEHRAQVATRATVGLEPNVPFFGRLTSVERKLLAIFSNCRHTLPTPPLSGCRFIRILRLSVS